MNGAAQRYRELMLEWDLARAEAGGTLPQKEDLRYAAAIDRCWVAMTEDEQDAYDEERARTQELEAPSSLEVNDTLVTRGAKDGPRQRVAA